MRDRLDEAGEHNPVVEWDHVLRLAMIRLGDDDLEHMLPVLDCLFNPSAALLALGADIDDLVALTTRNHASGDKRIRPCLGSLCKIQASSSDASFRV